MATDKMFGYPKGYSESRAKKVDSTYKWLKDRDVDGILNSQTVVITALIAQRPETISIPRYLLEKHSSIFKYDLAQHDIYDPVKAQRSIPLSLNSWYHRHGLSPNQPQDGPAVIRDWNILQIFCRWTLCGRIVGKPMMHPADVKWGLEVDPLCMADIAYWIMEDTKDREEKRASMSKGANGGFF